MERRLSGTMLLALSLILFAVAGLAKDKDRLGFSLPSGWKLANSASARDATTLELVKEGDSIDDWKELITIQTMVRPKSMHSLDEFYFKLKAGLEKDCPGVTNWHVIEQTEAGMTYEWSNSGPCMGQPEQTEIARILWSKKSLWALHYARKAKELPKDDRDQWLRWLSELRLTD